MSFARRTAAFFSFFLAACLLLGYSSTALCSLFSGRAQPVATDAAPLIILDAGHGGPDGGAIGTNGAVEKDLNLSITTRLAALLRLAGFAVLESRTDDRSLGEGAPKGGVKQADLAARLALTREYADCIFISIHMNTFPTESCRGVQVWYSENDARSREWAGAVQERVRQSLQPENNRKIKPATSGIYVLRHATVPAILIECGFLSTPDECERLCDEGYQSALVGVFFSVIEEKIAAHS